MNKAMSNTSETTVQGKHPERHQNGVLPYQAAAPSIYINPQYLPGGRRSLSGISIRAYGLGIALGLSSLLTAELAYFEYTIWRASCFITVLAVFHYLEFDMTARYNPPDAGTDSFLLLSNGFAYSIAHSTAMGEVLLRHWLQSVYKPKWLALPFRMPPMFPVLPGYVPVALGFFLIVLGQLVRSLAMRQAKTNFNHIVQYSKKEDHVLVTSGVYAFSRHPSYFGFFWWGLGTQLVLGNHFCFVAYAAVLWKFFSHRILYEERHLVSFFGQAYRDYRNRTRTWIPFVR